MMAYLNYFKLRLITNLQYRSAALAGIFTQLFFAGLFSIIYVVTTSILCNNLSFFEI